MAYTLKTESILTPSRFDRICQRPAPSKTANNTVWRSGLPPGIGLRFVLPLPPARRPTPRREPRSPRPRPAPPLPPFQMAAEIQSILEWAPLRTVPAAASSLSRRAALKASNFALCEAIFIPFVPPPPAPTWVSVTTAKPGPGEFVMDSQHQRGELYFETQHPPPAAPLHRFYQHPRQAPQTTYQDRQV